MAEFLLSVCSSHLIGIATFFRKPLSESEVTALLRDGSRMSRRLWLKARRIHTLKLSLTRWPEFSAYSLKTILPIQSQNSSPLLIRMHPSESKILFRPALPVFRFEAYPTLSTYRRQNGPDRTQNRSTDPKNSGVKTNAMIDDSSPELDAANVTPKILMAIDVVSRRLSNRRSHFMDGRVNISHGRRRIVDEQ
jgi:hypothetical protein